MRLVETGRFRRDTRLAAKRGKDLGLLYTVIKALCEEKPLAPERHDHALHGTFEGFRECLRFFKVPENDWLLMYAVNKKTLVLTASRTGAHSDLFR